MIRKNKVAEQVRTRIESCGEHLWRFSDFCEMSMTAVAKTLSRLSKKGVIIRLGKGLYYHPRQTTFGQSKPNLAQLRILSSHDKGAFPAGNSAANLLVLAHRILQE